MKTIAIFARILFAIPFLVFGIMHLVNGKEMAALVPAYFPGGVFWVYLTGIAKIAVAVSIITFRWTRVSGVMLALMLLVFVFTVHLPMAMSGVESKVILAMSNLLKDMGLAGGALLLASLEKEEA